MAAESPTRLRTARCCGRTPAGNCALVDGNKRTAWAAAWTFLCLNFMNEVATNSDLTIDYIAGTLSTYARSS